MRNANSLQNQQYALMRIAFEPTTTDVQWTLSIVDKSVVLREGLVPYIHVIQIRVPDSMGYDELRLMARHHTLWNQ